MVDRLDSGLALTRGPERQKGDVTRVPLIPHVAHAGYGAADLEVAAI
jgi:hypothetical protein